ncbi:hypothetical protein K2Y11_23480, partial [bacterium]|nr:hypothetical protein [bacterium]
LYSPNTLSLTLMHSINSPPSSIGNNLSGALNSTSRVVLTQKIKDRLVVTVAYSPEKIAQDPRLAHAKEVYIFDPSSGYMPNVIELWGRPDGPYKRYMSSFKRIDGDVWVAEKVIVESWLTGDDGRREQPTYTIKLDDIDLQRKPVDSTFTVDWIGPPVGTRIQDRMSGAETQFGIVEVDHKN